MTINANTRLGPYEIIALIGAGGMGEVYRAKDTKLERTVALKILPAEIASDQQRMHRFIQEAKSASALNHPNIITIYEIGQADSVNFIATEFIDGVTMREHLSSRRMKLEEMLDVAVQVASALSAAHAAGIVHRDIKPENIMLRRDGYVKVLDFGLAKLVERQTMVDSDALTKPLFKTAPGMVMGTVVYMSPEQARGLAVDARTDIWSFAVVLYEMVAGQAPFKGETATDVIVAVVKTEPPPLSDYVPDVPAELERIVMKALDKDREQRYQTIEDLLIDLRRLRKRVEAEAEMGRTIPLRLKGGVVSATSSGRSAIETPKRVSTAELGVAHPTSSAEYLVSAIKRNKKNTAVGLAILIISIVGVAYFSFVRSSNAAIDSIAVLPFTNITVDPSTEYLSDGITESIINSLSRLPRMRVMARSTVFSYKGQQVDPRKVGRDLGVDAVLMGRVNQRGDTLIIQADLVNVADGSQLWGEQYNRKFADIFAVQEEIAREVSDKLRLRLSGEQKQQLAKRYTENTEAYQLYLKGRYYWNKRTEETLKQAIEYFNQAIALDPSYALAYAGVADCYHILPFYSDLQAKDLCPKARAAAIKALEIDDTLAEAHAALAMVKWDYDWDFAGAEREFKQALELNPNYASVHQWYAEYLATMGRHEEAIAEAKRAREIDPLSLIINTVEGFIFYLARKYDLAIEKLRKTLEMDPNFARAHLYLGQAYVEKRRYEEAIAEFQKAATLSGNSPETLALLGYANAVSGKKSEAQKIVKELSERRYTSPYWMAVVHTSLNEKDQALARLEDAYESRYLWLVFFNVDPKFDSLRSDPRFAELVRRVGLTP
jgi:serine/threonine protein kinase/tetratricopeptide (TPR) repeat protein